ncbi:MAG: thiamine diphosphokinase [Elusimicrobiota bacterium]|nr:thiamine diphosphokinase [Elusimicrobiota bacterium]
MKLKSALIFLNGELRDPRGARAAARRADWTICADGGARHAAALRVRPDFVVGDMDSMPRRKRPSRHRITFIKPRPKRPSRHRITFIDDPDQSRSDLDKALGLARRLGARRVVVAAARGGGLDHELVNFAVLEKAERLDVLVIDGGTARLLGPGRHRLALKKGARFSLLAAPRARLSLSGARFALKNERLVRGSRGLGNRAEGVVVLTVREGRVWAVDAAPFRG